MKIAVSSSGDTLEALLDPRFGKHNTKTVIEGEKIMNLVDIMPIENWFEIEKEINKRSGLNAAVYDVNGLRITDFKKWANKLCPSLRATEKGQEFICALAHQNIAARAAKTRETIVAECDAGLMKFVVPIIVDDEFVGTAGGCGLLNNQGQVDAYLVHRTTDMDEKEVRNLAADIENIPQDRLADVRDFVEKKVAQSIQQHINEPMPGKQKAIGSAMSPPLIKKVLAFADPDRFSIVDAPPGTSCPVIETMKNADFVLMVTEPTPFGLHDLKLAVGAAEILGVPCGLVINRSDLGDDRVKEYAQRKKLPVLMEIAFDRRIAEAYSRAEVLVEVMPESKARFIELYEKVNALVN